MNMVQFLRKSIQNASEADLPALLQTAEFRTHLTTFLELNKKESTFKLLQLTNEDNLSGEVE